MGVKSEAIYQAAAATPPTTVTTLVFLGYPLDTWMQGLTVVYLIAQIAYLAWKFNKERKAK
jgi:hypothetical protein